MNKIIKSLMLVIIIMTIIFVKNEKTLALDFAVYTGGGPVNGSAPCSTSNCSDTDKNFYGIKITIKQENSKVLENYNGGEYFYLVNKNYKNNAKTQTGIDVKGDDKYIVFSDLPSTLAYPSGFSKYLSKDNLLNSDNSPKESLIKIIRAIKPGWITNSPGDNIYFEIEPVLALAYRRKTGNTWKNAYFFGTPSEVVNQIDKSEDADYTNKGMVKYKSNISDIARAVIMVNADYNTSWCSYYKDEGEGEIKKFSRYTRKNDIDDKYERSCDLMLSRWNVLRNYYTSLKINTTNISPYTKTVTNENELSALAFSQINEKSIYGKTLIKFPTISNTPKEEQGCDSELDKIKEKYKNDKDRNSAIKGLLGLHKEYKEYNMLLNFDNDFENAKCEVKDCTSSNLKSGSCLAYDSGYGSNDYSCASIKQYTATQDSTLEYMCNTNFSFFNNLNGTKFDIYPGRIIKGTDDIIGTGLLNINCFSTVNREISIDPNIIKSVKFNNVELNNTIIKGIDENNTIINNTDKIYIKPGEQSFDYSYIFTTLGNGISMPFSLKNNKTGFLKFEIEFNDQRFSNYTSENECKYEVISNQSLSDIEFRIIDTKKPFVDRNGKERNTMSNWCVDENKLNKNLFYGDYDVTTMDVGKLNSYAREKTNSDLLDIFSKEKYEIFNGGDVYNDGTINVLDVDVLNEFVHNKSIEMFQNPCSSDNVIVKNVISKNPNSYSNNPKYKIILTPQIMEDIKDYSKKNNITYDNFNFDCRAKCNDDSCVNSNSNSLCKSNTTTEDKVYKISKLLTYLKEKNDLTINYSIKRN